MRPRILIVDDEPLKRITLQIELSEAGYEVLEAADAEAARRLLDARPVDIVVTDVRMPGQSGLDLLTYVKQTHPHIEVILMTAYATVDTAVLAIKRGAYDYITKPFTTPDLLVKLDRLLASRRAVEADERVESFGGLVARSASMRRLMAQARGVAGTSRPILLCGESGVGKTLLAEAIHAQCPRAEKPFLNFACASTQPASIDSELFGCEKGVGGATRQKAGRIELAAGGTLLLGDVEALPAEAQARLLHVIEHQQFERVGAEQPIRAEARLICTTKEDLLGLVKAGRFREELYYRLNALCLAVPPLRDRPDDIPVLALHFIHKHAALVGDKALPIAPPAMDELMRYAWPGNVRELEHVLERALAFCGGSEIRPEHILPLGGPDSEAAPSAALELGEEGRLGLTETVADIERRMILLALRQCGNNQARAAQRLGIPRTTLRDKMAKYSIPGG